MPFNRHDKCVFINGSRHLLWQKPERLSSFRAILLNRHRHRDYLAGKAQSCFGAVRFGHRCGKVEANVCCFVRRKDDGLHLVGPALCHLHLVNKEGAVPPLPGLPPS